MAMLISLVSFAAEETGTLTFDDKAKRITFTTSQQVWTENGITVTNDKASSSSNVADYAKPARFYKSSKITVKCDLGTITKIVFDCNSSSYATALKNSITSGTVTASSDKVTVVPATESDTYVINSLTGGQVRMDALTVTYVAEEEDPYAPVYTITATSADETMGTVEGAGEYTEGKTVTLIAKANPGYEFVKWSNESTDNPLVFEATENVTLTASFQAQTPITIAEANKLADTKTCILKEVTVSYVYKSYIHIQDASGYGMIFQNNFGLKAGDVVTGLTCQKTTYNGLPQFVPTCTKADLTIVAGEAPAVAELTTAPTGNYHQVVKLMNVKMTGSFTTSSNSTLTATCPDGKTIAIYNGKNHAYTFVASKTYNITGDVCQYSGKIQVSAYAIEEYVAPEPCTLATSVNWDAPINAEANSDKWYAVNIASAKEAAKDLELTVSNPGEEAVKVTVEVYADCPATMLIAESTATINAGASKTKTVGYFDIFADLVDVIYFHVITEGGEIKVEAETAKFNVTATAENGTVEGAGVYEQGAEATLTATAAEGYEFVNWTSGETVVSTENPYKFTVTADVALVANFKEVVNVVTKEEKTTCVPGTLADGKVTHDLPCCVIVQEQGESTTALKSVAPWEAPSKSIMTITPKEGVTILKYVVNTKNTTLGTYLGKSELTNATKTATNNGLVTFTVTNGTEPVVMKFVSATQKFYEITFIYTIVGGTEPVKYTVTVKAENGTVEGAGEYEEGAEATLTATANEGFEFTCWTVGEDTVSTKNPYKFNVTADVEVVANFQEAAVVEPTTETVYFINNKGWSKVNAYAWEPVQNANWPGLAATKEAEQIGGYDVYSFTAEAGKYANVIFNNGSGQQTADLKWTAGKYVINNQWYTKEEAEAQLVKPVEYEYVYFVNVQAWNKVNIYTWTPEVGTWPGVAMTKEAEQLAGYDVYSYKAEKGTSFGGVIFNNGSGVQTGDLKWTAGKYYVKDGWYTKEEAIEKLSAPVTPPVITYVLMGIAGDWTTGIALTVNPDNANEYVLLGQEIAEGDAVKVVTLTDGVATAWCGNVDPASAAYTADDMGNIVLAPGKYDFYFKVKEDLIYIGAVKPEVITYELNGGEFPAVVVPTNAELWEAFKPYYNTYYGLARADQPIDKVSTFASAKMQEIMTDEASEYKWLGDYVQSVATAAGVPLSTDMASANESGWRWAVHAFFNAAAGQYGAAGIDFTEAGKPENWGAAYEAEYGVVLPTEPVAEDYVLPTPTKEGYTFVGWYDNAEGTGEPYKVIPAGWAGTLYAIWKQDTTTALDNIAVEGKVVKAIINGQLIIIKNGVQYNAQGVILK